MFHSIIREISCTLKLPRENFPHHFPIIQKSLERLGQQNSGLVLQTERSFLLTFSFMRKYMNKAATSTLAPKIENIMMQSPTVSVVVPTVINGLSCCINENLADGDNIAKANRPKNKAIAKKALSLAGIP
jgi:hypothetical protein